MDAPTTTIRDGRGREVAARRAVEEKTRELAIARSQPNIIDSEIRRIQRGLDRSAEAAHRAADALREVAEERFQAALRDHLPRLRDGVSGAPDPPPADLVAAFVLARLGEGFYDAIDEAIDSALADPSDASIVVATEAEVEAQVEAKRQDRRAAEDRIGKLERELSAAEADEREVLIARNRERGG